ncbi:hypothetical protein DMA11_11275 [Marinilabiliaceae bacterium JC017]|nr:hypothetical protein DMA11_11275 [Marinilabiliaceae bacterium JC017]
MHITGKMKMADMIQKDIQLLAVIQRLNIPLGFHEKTVREVCEENSVDLDFFLQLANASHDKDYFPQEHLLNFPVEWFINYLQSAHKCYLEHRIPEIENQIMSMEEQYAAQDRNMKILLNFFKEYIREFIAHIELEEQDVFPYILDINKQLINPPETKQPTHYTIDKYIEDHSNIEEKLYDLKNILLKYLPPPVISCTYNHLLFDIFRLENDLKDHSDLEEKVLIPKVRSMEEELRSRNSHKAC